MPLPEFIIISAKRLTCGFGKVQWWALQALGHLWRRTFAVNLLMLYLQSTYLYTWTNCSVCLSIWLYALFLTTVCHVVQCSSLDCKINALNYPKFPIGNLSHNVSRQLTDNFLSEDSVLWKIFKLNQNTLRRWCRFKMDCSWIKFLQVL